MTTTNQHQQPPTGRVAIYTRGERAAAQASTLLTQTSELLALALERGYGNGQIVLFEEGYVSGDAASERRHILLDLLAQITKPQPGQEPIKALFVDTESRLFRDSEVVQVSAFIELCRTYQVLLVTPTRTYDFSKPIDVKYFRFLCETGSQEINRYITSRLQAGKRRAAARRLQAHQQPEQ